MHWRVRYAWRRLRLRFARLASRSPLGTLVRVLLPMYLVIGLAVGGLLWVRSHPQGAADAMAGATSVTAHWAERGWRVLVGRLSLRLDAETGEELLQSVLPAISQSSSGPEPPDSWRTPLRAWVFTVTGYDFSNARSFLEAEVGGFKVAVQSGLDVVRLPERRSESPPKAAPDGTDEALPEASRRDPGETSERSISEPEDDPIGVDTDGRRREVGVPGQGDEPFTEDRDVDDMPEATTEPEAKRDVLAGENEKPPSGLPPALASLARIPWGDDPLVLIFHSHTSESYRTIPPHPRADAHNHVVNESDTGITRVGRVLAEKLQEQYQIGTIHSTRVYNWPHHWAAYKNSRESVEEFLRRYPSIKVVLDIHRQGVQGLTYAATVSGAQAVQVEIIYTTAQTFKYGAHPRWRENEAFAVRLAQAMDDIHPGLLREIMRIDDRRFNQDLHPRMLLLEVGNYIDLEEHALTAAELLADPIAQALAEIRTEQAPALSGASNRVVPPDPPRPQPVRTAPRP